MDNSCGCNESGPSPQWLPISICYGAPLILLKCLLSQHCDLVFHIGVSEIFLYGLDVK